MRRRGWNSAAGRGGCGYRWLQRRAVLEAAMAVGGRAVTGVVLAVGSAGGWTEPAREAAVARTCMGECGRVCIAETRAGCAVQGTGATCELLVRHTRMLRSCHCCCARGGTERWPAW